MLSTVGLLSHMWFNEYVTMRALAQQLKSIWHAKEAQFVSLSAERTHLANERTLLSYVRTSLATFVAGAAFIHFSDGRLLALIVGVIFMLLALLGSLVGFTRFDRMQTLISTSGAVNTSDED